MKLTGNTVLITGGATGIGLALAKRLVRAGNSVAICGRRVEVLKAAKAKQPELSIYAVNLAFEEDRKQIISRVITDLPAFNILINNAGIQNRPPKLTEAQDWTTHASEIATNLNAPIHLSMLAIPHLLTKPRAQIVNITSGLAFQPIASMATYCATKAGLHSFTQSLRWQLKDTHIRVVEIAPPAVQTDLGGPGLHDFGAPLDAFADHAFQRWEAGDLEFGYQSSERARLIGKPENELVFNELNSRW